MTHGLVEGVARAHQGTMPSTRQGMVIHAHVGLTGHVVKTMAKWNCRVESDLPKMSLLLILLSSARLEKAPSSRSAKVPSVGSSRDENF